MAEKETGTRTGFHNIKNDVRQYVEKRFQLIVLNLGERISSFIADTIQRVTGLLILATGFLIAWFALCFFLSELVESFALGFLLGSIPLLLFGVIFVKLKPRSFTRSIQESIMNEIISSLDEMTDGQEKKEEKQTEA